MGRVFYRRFAPPRRCRSSDRFWVEPYQISHGELAQRLGVPVGVVDGLMAGVIELNAEMAVRLELVFDRSAESWLSMQSDHSLQQARKAVAPESVRPFSFPPRADAA